MVSKPQARVGNMFPCQIDFLRCLFKTIDRSKLLSNKGPSDVIAIHNQCPFDTSIKKLFESVIRFGNKGRKHVVATAECKSKVIYSGFEFFYWKSVVGVFVCIKTIVLKIFVLHFFQCFKRDHCIFCHRITHGKKLVPQLEFWI